ncbi:MAG: carbamoyltransferase N-terminal domain-containing protein [candidate division WOR-3 bacterium]|jgi:carbamoyltransferase
MSEIEILGISALFHDSSVTYIKKGKVIAALQEERFSKIKFDERLPELSIEILKKKFDFDPGNLKAIVFYDKPILKFERIIENLIYSTPKNFEFAFTSLPLWIKDKLYTESKLRKLIKGNYKIFYVPHHVSHISSSFYPSDLERAAFMVNDGVGEWETTTLGVVDDKSIKILYSIDYPHSLGMFYSTFTYFTGFKVNSGEYKLMGLAPYGVPRYVSLIKENLIDIKDDGSYRLNLKFFDFQNGLQMCGKQMEKLFGIKIRKEEQPLNEVYADIAASVQKVLEEILIKMALKLKSETKEKNLIIGGGVGLNCVANSKVLESYKPEKFFIQPASGDAGGSLGAALYVANRYYNLNIRGCQNYSFLGTEYSDHEIEESLKRLNGVYKKITNPDVIGCEEILKKKVVGWFQGKMEYGPRALGNRSILGDPTDPEMQKIMNMKIKFRESFRPLAPAVLEDKYELIFKKGYPTHYMLTVCEIKDDFKNTEEFITHDFKILRKSITQFPSVVHSDFTSRVQLVSKESNPLFYSLIYNFYERTGCPMVINTSFNVRGQPIVENPEDAFKTFIETDIDVLIIGNFLLRKEEQVRKKGDFKIEKRND